MKKIIIILLIIAMGGILYVSFNDIKSSKYDTYEEAITDIERGWIPGDIPKSAT